MVRISASKHEIDGKRTLGVGWLVGQTGGSSHDGWGLGLGFVWFRRRNDDGGRDQLYIMNEGVRVAAGVGAGEEFQPHTIRVSYRHFSRLDGRPATSSRFHRFHRFHGHLEDCPIC